MKLFPTLLLLLLPPATNLFAAPLPIDPLWKTEAFRKAMTGSYGIDSRIEPQITIDEEEFLEMAAKEMAAGNREAAIKILSETSLLENSPALLFALANLQFETEAREDAVASFEKAIKQFPNFRDAHRNLAIALVQMEELEKAMEHLIRAIELGSREGVTMGLLGYCHSIEENHQAALQAYRLAQLTMPKERQWIIGEAQALQSLQKPREAASLYRSLLKDNPTESPLWLNLANTGLQSGQPLDAIAGMDIARRSGAMQGRALLSLGNLYLNESLPADAASSYLAALKSPELPALEKVIESVEYLTTRKEWDIAAKVTAAVREVFPDAGESKKFTRSLALIEFETGDTEAAVSKIRALVDSDPMDGQSIILLAGFQKDKGAREESEMLFEQAALLPEHEADALTAHGKLLVEVGEYQAASEKLGRALQLKPSPSLSEYLAAVKKLITD